MSAEVGGLNKGRHLALFPGLLPDFILQPKDLGGGLRMRLGDILYCKHPQNFLHFFV